MKCKCSVSDKVDNDTAGDAVEESLVHRNSTGRYLCPGSGDRLRASSLREGECVIQVALKTVYSTKFLVIINYEEIILTLSGKVFHGHFTEPVKLTSLYPESVVPDEACPKEKSLKFPAK